MTMPTPSRPLLAHMGLLTIAAAISIAPAGCALPTLAGGMAESYKRSSTHTIPSEYDGLKDKSFAVIVAAERMIQSSRPKEVARLTTLITQQLITHAEAAGVVPPSVILEYQYNRPRWVTMTYAELAKEFGVERLIYIDLYEFRLNDPGNAYLWEGLAAATIGVVEADGPLGDEFIYSKQISVHFPDEDGYGPTDYTGDQIAAVLEKRFVDRLTWLFYDHEEPYYPKY